MNTENNLVVQPQLTPFEVTKEDLQQLAKDYSNMVVTRETLKEADKARLTLKNKRLEIERTAKSNRKTIKEFLKSKVDDLEDELVGIISPIEKSIADKVDKVNAEIEEEKRIEARRVDMIKSQIETIKQMAIEVVSLDSETRLQYYSNIEFEFDFQEFFDEASAEIAKLKNVASERLKMVVFNRQQREAEEAAALESLKNVEAETEVTVELEIVNNDFVETTPSIDKASHALTGGVILPKEDNGFSNRPAFGEAPKINPSKPVILGSNVETKSDKELLEEFANKLVLLPNPHVVSEKAQKHLDFVQGMLAKLADQTIKVAGGL